MRKEELSFENIHPEQYTYTLPEEFIAKKPLTDRSSSKLLRYQQGEIFHEEFRSISQFLPENARLIFNDTKVIAARIIAFKETGAKIEIFLLEPIFPTQVMEEAMHQTRKVQWRCMIGNAKKWKQNSSLIINLENDLSLRLERTSEDVVQLDWDSDSTFSEIIDKIGKVPLPPYIDREPSAFDIPRYQTVYSKAEGAVAAPTAGLHFTDEVMESIHQIAEINFVTLHVSAGTFQPIKTNASEHPMHREELLISKETIEQLLQEQFVVAVGTTSMRTLESLYWYGVKLSQGEEDFIIEKLFPYQIQDPISLSESIQCILDFMASKSLSVLRGYTEIFIFPGYDFKVCKGLITNFHLPGTTLMMLIAAFVGPDWEKIYQEAIENSYRFLSYGDSSLLFPNN